MEVTAQALNRRSFRKMFVHPNEKRFSKETLVTELERQGLIVGKNIVERLFGDFIYGVGRR